MRILSALLLVGAVRGDENGLPGPGFTPDRYHRLWTESPFAVATAETVVSSPDFSLVGIAQFDGVSYASLIDKSNQEHFLLSSTTPARGLSLVSLNHGENGSASSAVVQRNGELLTLALEAMPNNPAPPPAPPASNGMMLPASSMQSGAPISVHMPPHMRRLSPVTIPPPPAGQALQPSGIAVPLNPGR